MPTTAKTNGVDLDAVVALVQSVTDDPAAAATEWRADVKWHGGFRSSATIREFQPVPSDEPPGLGGTDAAPNPVEQIAAALGNCLVVGYVAALTAQGITIRSLDIAVTGKLDLRPFLGVEPGHAGYSQVDVEVDIDADADPETLQAIHERVVATSPVGQTLTNPVGLSVRLAGS
jgi:uncharacterized OsmC-like protein